MNYSSIESEFSPLVSPSCFQSSASYLRRRSSKDSYWFIPLPSITQLLVQHFQDALSLYFQKLRDLPWVILGASGPMALMGSLPWFVQHQSKGSEAECRVAESHLPGHTGS